MNRFLEHSWPRRLGDSTSSCSCSQTIHTFTSSGTFTVVLLPSSAFFMAAAAQ